MSRATRWETSHLVSAWACRLCWTAFSRSPDGQPSGLHPTPRHLHTCPVHMHRPCPSVNKHRLLPVGLCSGRSPHPSLHRYVRPLPTTPGPAWVPSVLWKRLSPQLVPQALACSSRWPSKAQVTAAGRVLPACYLHRPSALEVSWRSASTRDFMVAPSVQRDVHSACSRNVW